jgi:hypothetical protein
MIFSIYTKLTDDIHQRGNIYPGRPTADQELLGRILASFGRIGSNVNQLARVANAGSWPDSRLLKQACDDIRIIRDTLFRALGFTPPDDPPHRPDGEP